MLATKDYKKEDVIKSMKILKKCNISEKLSARLYRRYENWKKIANTNELIAKSLMEE